MNSFINALKRPPSWKSLFIFYTLFIFFIVQVALFENEIIEDLIEIISNSKIELIKTAYHLGNRHVEVEIEEGILLTKSDHVIKNMLLNFKVNVKNTKKKFFPERGAHSHD